VIALATTLSQKKKLVIAVPFLVGFGPRGITRPFYLTRKKPAASIQETGFSHHTNGTKGGRLCGFIILKFTPHLFARLAQIASVRSLPPIARADLQE